MYLGVSFQLDGRGSKSRCQIFVFNPKCSGKDKFSFLCTLFIWFSLVFISFNLISFNVNNLVFLWRNSHLISLWCMALLREQKMSMASKFHQCAPGKSCHVLWRVEENVFLQTSFSIMLHIKHSTSYYRAWSFFHL